MGAQGVEELGEDLGVRGPPDGGEHVAVGDAELEGIRVDPRAPRQLHDGAQAEERRAARAAAEPAGRGEQELAVAREHQGPPQRRERRDEVHDGRVRAQLLREPPARDDQRVVARRVRRRRGEVGGYREAVARELRVELRGAGRRLRS